MNNNQNLNDQNNLGIPNLDNMNNQMPLNNGVNNNLAQDNSSMLNGNPMVGDNMVGNNQNNFDPLTGQPINQVPVQNDMNNQMSSPAPKKGNGAFIAIVIVLAVIILGLIVYIAFGDSIKSALSGKKEPDITENGGGNNVVNNTAETVTVDGYDFQVPGGFEISSTSGYTMLLDNTNKVAIVPYVSPNIAYSDLISKSANIKTVLEGKGVTVTSYEEKTFGGQKWLVVNYYKGTASAQHSFTALDSNNIFEVDCYNLGKTLSDDQVYSLLNKMVSSAKISDGSSFSPNENGGTKSVDFSESLFK